jgi:hypothetical protein
MDKTGQALYVRFPLSLEAKLRDRAMRNGRTLTQQIVYDCALAEHFQDFHIENSIQNFFEREGKNS